MVGQPRLDRLSGAVGQEIEWPSGLQVEENRAVGVCASEGKVITAQPSDLGEGSVFEAAQVAQQGWRFAVHSQAGSQAFTH